MAISNKKISTPMKGNRIMYLRPQMVGIHRGKTNNNNGGEPSNGGHSKVDSCAFLSGRATLGKA